MAMHVISKEKLGLPQNSRDAFEILFQEGFIHEDLLTKLRAMIGFRNIAVHNYQKINLAVVQNVIEHHLDDFRDFIAIVNNWMYQ